MTHANPEPAPKKPADRATEAADPQHWSQRYRDDRTPWDMRGPTPVFVGLAERGELPLGPHIDDDPAASADGRATRVWMPGAGSGYDAVMLAQHGYDVTPVDFAAEPLERCSRLAADAGVAELVHPFTADLFDTRPPFNARIGTFDLCVEYTCYCAVPPSRREDYVAVVARSIRPGGFLVGLFFPTDGRAGGPPFAVEPDEIVAQFAAHNLVLISRATPADSHPMRAGKEQLLIFQQPPS